MNKTLLLFLLLPFVQLAQSQRVQELKALAEQIQNDASGKDVLLSLKPSMEDFQGVFQTVQDVGDVWMYTEDVYLDLEKEGIKIPEGYTEIEIKSALISDLRPGVVTGFPEAYLNITNRMKLTARIYLIEYRKPKNDQPFAIDVFFHVNNHWVFIPSVYRAFE